MHKKTSSQSTEPFKAKLRHYHRTASPSLYSRKQKRWEDVSASELSDSSVSESQGAINLGSKDAPKPSSNKTGEG